MNRQTTTNDPPAPTCWFKAKRYGWGWGLPCRWQGWVFFSIWLLSFAGIALLLAHHAQWIGLALWHLAMIVVLLLIYWQKGEPACWRWGEE